MTTAKDQFKTDLQKDPEELEREANSARADLEGTVDELMQQFSPGELLNQGITYLRRKGDPAFVHNLTSQVENNPLPSVLLGVSLVWLMAASKQPPVHQGESLKDSISRKAGATRDKLSSATGNVRSSSHDATERTREKGQQVASGASDVMHRVTDATRHTADSARSGLHSAREGYTHMLREQPLLVGALAVAAGAALGALLPRTSAEDSMMGGMSDRGTDTLREKTEGKLKEEQDKAHSHSSDESDQQGRSTSTSGQTAAGSKASSSSSGYSGSGGSPGGTGASSSGPQPPQLDPNPSGTGRGSSHQRP